MSTVSEAQEENAVAPGRAIGDTAARVWLAALWPKAAVTFGIVLTFAWVVALIWLLNLILNLF